MQPSQMILKYFDELYGAGKPEVLSQWQKAEMHSSAWGDCIKLYTKRTATTIESIQWQAYGGVYTLAILSWFSQHYAGKDIVKFEKLDIKKIEHELSIPADKRYILLLIEDCLKLILK